MLMKSLLLLLPLCNGARESRKQYKPAQSVNQNGLENDLSQNSPFDYAYTDELDAMDYNFFPTYEDSDGHDPFYDLDRDGFDNTDDRGGGDYYADYDYYYDENPKHEPGSSLGHLTQEQNDDPFSIFYDSLFSDVGSVIPEESHLPEETNSENYQSSSISTTSTTTKPVSTSSTTQTSQQRFRPLNIPAHFISKPKTEEKKEELSDEMSTTTTAVPKLRPINIPAHFITKPKLSENTQYQNTETEPQSTNGTDFASLSTRLRPLEIPAEFISLPKPAKPQPINIKEIVGTSHYLETTTRPKPSIKVKKPSKTPLDVLRLKQIMPLVLKQLGLPSSVASTIFKNEEAVNKLVKQLDKMDDFKGLLQHLDLGALASMISGTDASVALNLLQGSNLSMMTGLLKTLGIDTSYIDGIFNRIGAAAAPPSTKAEDDDSKFLYLPLVDSGSVSNVQVIGFVVLLLFLLTTAYAYMEYGLLDATGGTVGSYTGYDTGSFGEEGYDRHTTGGHPVQQNLGWSDGSGLWLPVLESAEADAYYYPGPDPPEDEHLKEYTHSHTDSAEVSISQQHEPWRQPEESYYQRETQPREPEETYYESHVEDEVQYTSKRPRYRQRTQKPRRPSTTTTTTQRPRRTTTTTQRPRRPTTSTRWGGQFPAETKARTQRPIDGQSHARRPASTQNRRVYTTSDQNRRHSISYNRRPPVAYRYNGNRRYSNNRNRNYYNPSPPQGGYLKLKPIKVRNSDRRSGVSNRRYIDDRPSYDEYYEDYEDPDHYEYVSDDDYSDYSDYSDDYYDDDQTDTVTEGRSNSDKPPYEPLKLNSFHGQANKLSALSQVRLSTVDKKSTTISSTASPITVNTPSTTLASSSSLSSSPPTTPTSTRASTTTPNPDIRPTSKIISTIKQRRTDTFSDEHSQDWLRFIHKLA